MQFKSPGNTKYGKRHVPGQMNQTESAYADVLEQLKTAGEIIAWEFEAIKLKLAANCFYTPDFFTLMPDGSLTMIDVKGTGPIDNKSVVKIKCAADKFFMFRFAFAIKQRKCDGGGWVVKEF